MITTDINRIFLLNNLRVSLKRYALIRNNGAIITWTTSLKILAFWMELGVKKSGMKGYESIWNSSKTPIIKKVAPMNSVWSSWFLLYANHVIVKMDRDTKTKKNSIKRSTGLNIPWIYALFSIRYPINKTITIININFRRGFKVPLILIPGIFLSNCMIKCIQVNLLFWTTLWVNNILRTGVRMVSHFWSGEIP